MAGWMVTGDNVFQFGLKDPFVQHAWQNIYIETQYWWWRVLSYLQFQCQIFYLMKGMVIWVEHTFLRSIFSFLMYLLYVSCYAWQYYQIHWLPSHTVCPYELSPVCVLVCLAMVRLSNTLFLPHWVHSYSFLYVSSWLWQEYQTHLSVYHTLGIHISSSMYVFGCFG